jgi:arginase
MLKIHIIAPSVTEASPDLGTFAADLSDAASIIEASGFYDELPKLGVEIEGITRPEPVPPDLSDDPAVLLGEFNAQIAAAVSAAIGRGAQPFMAGGTCNHLPGMVGGLEQAYGSTARIGLIWMDAHGDFNTPATSYSQMLGGMPVAVVAGLCYPAWRERSGIEAPMPTDRILMIDVRNLDDREETLIRSTDVTIARFGENFDAAPIEAAIDRLAADCDLIYVHVDADILDASLQPNHPTAEPNGPDLATVISVLDYAFATGKASGFGVVSVNPNGEEGAISLASGTAMIVAGTKAWLTNGERRV